MKLRKFVIVAFEFSCKNLHRMRLFTAFIHCARCGKFSLCWPKLATKNFSAKNVWKLRRVLHQNVLWCRIHISNTKQKHFKSFTNPAIIQIKAYNLVCKLRGFLGRVFDTFYLARSWPTMTMTIRQYFCLPKFPDCFRWCHQKRSVIYSQLSYSFLAQRTAQFDATSLLWKLCRVLPTKNGGHCTITSLSFPMQQLFIRPQ